MGAAFCLLILNGNKEELDLKKWEKESMIIEIFPWTNAFLLKETAFSNTDKKYGDY